MKMRILILIVIVIALIIGFVVGFIYGREMGQIQASKGSLVNPLSKAGESVNPFEYKNPFENLKINPFK